MSSMRARHRTPQRPTAQTSRRASRRAAARVQAGFERATWRYCLGEIARGLPALSSRALAAAFPAMLRTGTVALEDGRVVTIPPCPMLGPDESLADPGVAERVAPSARWIALARTSGAGDEAPASIVRCLDRHRTGRPLLPVAPSVEAAIMAQILLPGGATEAQCLRAAQSAARAAGLPLPTRALVRRVYKRVPPEQHAAARHGKHAAVADALPKGALPWRRPGECYLLDETKLPVYIRAWSEATKQYVALKAWACFVIDVASEVIVGYHVATPIFGGQPRGIDGQDIFGAFASAIFPDVASPACRPYVGLLPTVMRCDNVAAHGTVNTRAARAGIDVSHNPTYKPWANSVVETLNSIIKPLCAPLVGYDVHWKVAEYEGEDGVVARRRLAATESRLPPHIAVRIEDLLDVQTLRDRLDEIVRQYNEELQHTRWRTTRQARFMEQIRREEFRTWQDGLAMLDPVQVHVREHIEIRRVAFSATDTAGQMRAWGAPVCVQLDPLLRACWETTTRDGHPAVATFLPAKQVAQQRVPADVVREQEAKAQHASDVARAARREYQVALLGSAAAADLADAVATPPRRKGSTKKKTGGAGAAKKASRRRATSITAPTSAEQLEWELAPAAPPLPVTPVAAIATPPATPILATRPPSISATPPTLAVVPGAGVALPRGIARRPTALTLVASRRAPATPTTADPDVPTPTEATA